LHFLIFKKYYTIIQFSSFLNPSNEILLFLIHHKHHLGINSCKEQFSGFATPLQARAPILTTVLCKN
jgi:hypothetical protein